jgi:hypothetical protein
LDRKKWHGWEVSWEGEKERKVVVGSKVGLHVYEGDGEMFLNITRIIIVNRKVNTSLHMQ